MASADGLLAYLVPGHPCHGPCGRPVPGQLAAAVAAEGGPALRRPPQGSLPRQYSTRTDPYLLWIYAPTFVSFSKLPFSIQLFISFSLISNSCSSHLSTKSTICGPLLQREEGGEGEGRGGGIKVVGRGQGHYCQFGLGRGSLTRFIDQFEQKFICAEVIAH